LKVENEVYSELNLKDNGYIRYVEEFNNKIRTAIK
jgi:hypothetical protein